MSPKEAALETDKLLESLKRRFLANKSRHAAMDWGSIETRLVADARKLRTLSDMEMTGGEPDVIGRDPTTGAFVFCDCSPESPAGRRSLCYDGAALDARKENKPRGSVVEMATLMGIELLNERHYRDLQTLGAFDRKTSSWIATPDYIRTLGGALFCDRRYNHVFVYHNGAESYYAARGFRGRVTI